MPKKGAKISGIIPQEREYMKYVFNVKASEDFRVFVDDLCEQNYITGGDLREQVEDAVYDFLTTGDESELVYVLEDSLCSTESGTFSNDDFDTLMNECAVLASRGK